MLLTPIMCSPIYELSVLFDLSIWLIHQFTKYSSSWSLYSCLIFIVLLLVSINMIKFFRAWKSTWLHHCYRPPRYVPVSHTVRLILLCLLAHIFCHTRAIVCLNYFQLIGPYCWKHSCFSLLYKLWDFVWAYVD